MRINLFILYKIKLLIVLLIIFLTNILQAQKVALVLSGGGAKGVAHIGVIKALEENGIPIDYIAGTSIGAIIGGLYACGYSPEDMERILTSKEFSDWTSGKIDEKYVYYFKRNAPNASWMDFNFNYDSTLHPQIIPSSIISPIQMDFEFMQFFSGANAVCNNNFDSLFVPFRCIATDIQDHKAVVLKNGYVDLAIRASMTFPFLFKPIRINGKLMFDGGMYNNFPADVAHKDFSPDVIIGSKVAGNYDIAKDENLVSQIETMLMEKTDYSLKYDSSVLIEPEVKPVNVIDFSNTQAFIDSGYTATIRKIKEIRKFVKDTVNIEDLNKKRKAFIKKEPPLIINKIYINGLNKKQSHYVNSLLLHKSKLISIKNLKKEYFKILADDKIKYISPKAKYNKKTGYYDLYLNVKKNDNIQVQLGGNVSSNLGNEAFVGLQYKYLEKKAVSIIGSTNIGRFYSSAQLKTKVDYPTKLPFYIESDISFNQWDYFETSSHFIEDKTPSFLVQNENHIQGNIGVPSGNKAKFVIGLAGANMRDDYYQTNNFTRSDTVDRTCFNVLIPKILYELNTLNMKQYANNGNYLLLELKYISGKEKNIPGSTSKKKNLRDSEDGFEKYHNWFQLKFKYDNYFKTNDFLNLGVYAEAVISNQDFFNNYTASVLSAPAFQPIPENKTLFIPEYRAHNYFALGLKNIFTLGKYLNFRVEGYVFQPYRVINRQDDFSATYGDDFLKRYYMASSALVFHSPLGPVSLNFNWYDRSKDPFTFSFNFGYIIFNKRAIE